MPQGSVKQYDWRTKTGIIATDDGAEFAIDQASIDDGMFRFFRPGQRVTFDIVQEDDASRARNLRIGKA